MNAVHMIHDVVGLNRSLSLCGVSKTTWYYTPTPRNVSPDPEILETMQKIGLKRPTYIWDKTYGCTSLTRVEPSHQS